MIYKVKVTEKHILMGCKLKGNACPVFLAMKDAGLPVEHVSSYDWLDVVIGDPFDYPNHSQPLPDEAKIFIRAFDEGRPVEPIEFEIEYGTRIA